MQQTNKCGVNSRLYLFVNLKGKPHAVSVHVDGIMEALVKIYDAHRVAKELTCK